MQTRYQQPQYAPLPEERFMYELEEEIEESQERQSRRRYRSPARGARGGRSSGREAEADQDFYLEEDDNVEEN